MIQGTFFQKVLLSLICGAVFAGVVEFYKTFIDGAEQALNGKKGGAAHGGWGAHR